MMHLDQLLIYSFTHSFTSTNKQVQCDTCEKWRMLPPSLSESDLQLPDNWFCEMNHFDKCRSKCNAIERNATYMHKFFQEQASRQAMGKSTTQNSQPENSQGLNVPPTPPRESVDTKTPEDDEHVTKTNRDEVLVGLLKAQTPKMRKKKDNEYHQSSLIAKHYFHDTLMREANAAPIDT